MADYYNVDSEDNEQQGWRKPKEEVDVKWLSNEFERVRSDLSDFRQTAAKNADVRFCKWPNQSEDGRKQYDKASPWKGASDLRYPLVDDIINTNVSTLVLSLSGANVQAVPVESSDVKRAKLVGEYMRWRMFTEMTELPDEAEYAAQWLLEKGGAVVGVFWHRETLKHLERVDAQDIEQRAAEANFIQPNRSILDPLEDKLLRAFLIQAYPAVEENMMGKAIEELRTQGSTNLPVVSQYVNRPMIRAFKKGEDIIFSKNATNLQNAPVVYRVEYKTPQQLLGYVATDDWDEDWVMSVIKGTRTSFDDDAEAYERSRYKDGVTFHDDRKNLIRVVWAYQKLVDENDIQCIYETVFSPRHYPEEGIQPYAKSGMLDYHMRGMYPFWDFSRENISRLSYNSRGIPARGKDFQRIAKWQWDADIDNSSLRMNPPRWFIFGRPPPEHGPGGQYPVSRPGESGYIEGPDFNPADRDLRQEIINQARAYHGLLTSEDMVPEARAKQQMMVNRWMRDWQMVFRMVWWLDQQFGDPVKMFRVMGSNSVGPQEFTRNPTEQIDFYLTFDVLSNDPEAMEQKISNILRIGSEADRNGIIDWSEMVRVAVEAVDPVLAERIVKPEEQATQDQEKEAVEHFQKLWAGMDVTLPEQGVNAQVYRQRLQEWIQGSEDVPAQDVQQRLQTDEAFKARIEKLVKQLDFQDQQRQNAQTGRLGVNQGNMQ